MSDDNRVASLSLITLFAMVTAAAPLSMDIYIPVLPELAQDLKTTAGMTQLTVTFFLIGLTVGQFIFGPISDSTGRRPMLIIGLAGWTAASLACALASDVQVLLFARLFQGIFASATIVLSNAALSDRLSGSSLARGIGTLTIVQAAVPILAPVIGGAIAATGGWRLTFIVLVAYGIITLIAIIARCPETLPAPLRRRADIASLATSTWAAAQDRTVIGGCVVLGFTSVAFFSYIAGTAFVVQTVYGHSVQMTSYLFAINSLGLVGASAAFAMLSNRTSIRTLIFFGAAVCGVAPLAAMPFVFFTPWGFHATSGALLLFVMGNGFVFPGVVTLVQDSSKGSGGASAALLGGVQFAMGALGSPLLAAFGDASAAPLLAVMGCASVIAFFGGFIIRSGPHMSNRLIDAPLDPLEQSSEIIEMADKKQPAS